MTDAPHPIPGETVEPYIAGKAYLAVLKHHLAHGSAGKSSRAIFDETYRAVAGTTRCEPLESLGITRPK